MRLRSSTIPTGGSLLNPSATFDPVRFGGNVVTDSLGHRLEFPTKKRQMLSPKIYMTVKDKIAGILYSKKVTLTGFSRTLY